jgi:NAD-dependent SIR2 family protein deacetylase
MSDASAIGALYRHAADLVRTADALLIGAGAGMGVDSGLPDFRGPEGFWQTYPPFRGRHFAEMSNPHWFQADPVLAWGFFGHRLNLYRSTAPHAGFEILGRWGEARPHGYFVFTSNVDGHFQWAGFPADRVLECHGSIHYLQCAHPCGSAIWPADDTRIAVDAATIRANSELPACPHCGGIARPNILMFGDWNWIRDRHNVQRQRYERWLRRVKSCCVVAIELGAGLAIPTVRYECERRGNVLIRVNPREADTPPGGISLPVGALHALSKIEACLR